LEKRVGGGWLLGLSPKKLFASQHARF